MEWKEVRLGDVCTRVCSGGTPKSTNLSYYGGKIPWLNTKEIDFNRIYFTEKTITDSGLNNSSAKWIVPNTVTVAMYNPQNEMLPFHKTKCSETQNEASSL